MHTPNNQIFNCLDFGLKTVYNIYIYIWKKKTNKLQVHPYKPVSWSPTHQGIYIYIYIYINDLVEKLKQD